MNAQPQTYGGDGKINTSDWLPRPGSTAEFTAQRPDCEHNFTFRAHMMNGAIDEKQVLAIRESLRNTPCSECQKKKKEEKHATDTTS